MGTLLIAKCECGFEKEKIYLGAGMEQEGECYIPALMNNSSEIFMINIRNITNRDKYVFYSDSILYQDIIDKDYFQAWEFKLKETDNLCPLCKNFSMKFIIRGQFD